MTLLLTSGNGAKPCEAVKVGQNSGMTPNLDMALCGCPMRTPLATPHALGEGRKPAQPQRREVALGRCILTGSGLTNVNNMSTM